MAYGLTLAAQTPTATLVGWATLPVQTVSDGPTTGQFAGPGQFGHTWPLSDHQVVQGFSAVLPGPVAGTYYVLPDNGYGTKANSADALLRVYALRPDFRTETGGTGTVTPVDYRTGAPLSGFLPASFIQLRDPDHKLTFPLVADQDTYTTAAGSPRVDPRIKANRWLTGADLDPESMRTDHRGDRWYGDEFGPFLIHADGDGKVLGAEVRLSGVMAPENPHRGTAPANLGSSRGFEGLAINPARTRLYGLIEGTVTGDRENTLRIHEFDVDGFRYTGRTFAYRLDPDGTNIGDMTAVNDHEFLVLERNGAAGAGATPAPVKKVFLVDIADIDQHGDVKKTLLVDLMRLADPHDLNRDGQTTFTFPFVTVEDVLVIDAHTILVINDNNYPGGGGRGAFSDPTEFLLIRVEAALRVDGAGARGPLATGAGRGQ